MHDLPSTVLKRAVRIGPVWLGSLVLHLLGLLTLAWWTLTPDARSPPELLLVAAFEDAAPTFDSTDDRIALDATSLDSPAPAFDSAPPPAVDVVAPALAESLATALDELPDVEPPGVDRPSDALAQVGDLLGSLVGGPDGGRGGSGVSGQAAKFFGVSARGSRFVFIVDSSNSMRGAKFAEAKRELLYAVRRLSKDQSFYVIFFDGDMERMALDDSGDPAPTLVPATGENLLQLERWVATVQNELKTNPYEAVEFALSLSPDAIFLLTDGQFTDRGRTVRYLARANLARDDLGRRTAKTAVHTIGFYSRSGEDVLQEIARKHRGEYQFVGRE